MTFNSDKHERSVFHLEQSTDRWQRALSAIPNAHPLQSWQWGAFKERWGWQAFPLTLTVGNESDSSPPLAAALILKRKVPGLPFSILYVPKGPVLDYSYPALRRVVLAQLEGFARQEGAIFVKIDPDVIAGWGEDDSRRSPISAKFVEELEDRGWRFSQDQIQFRNTVHIDLAREEGEILASMKQKTRYNIRLAARREVTVRLGNSNDLPLIADMYADTAARDQFTVRPIDYYLDIWRSFFEAGIAQPFIAEYNQVPLGAVIIVSYGQRAYYMYGASSGKERQRMPNHLLQWEAIRWSKSQGNSVYDMWGAPDEFVESDPLWGVWRFKAGFNGQVIKHIGAWDYPNRPFWYWIYTVIIPKYVEFLRSRGNRSIGGVAQS